MPCPALVEINNNVVGEGMTGLITPQWLSQQLDNSCKDEMLLLDCRSPNDYNKSHITGALHVALPSIMQRRLQKGSLHVDSVISSLSINNKGSMDNKWRGVTLVLYDDCTMEANLTEDSAKTVILLLRLLSEDGYSVCMLKGGFVGFKESYSRHCLSLSADKPDDTNHAILGLRNLRISGSEEEEDDGNTPNSSDQFPVEVLPHLYLGNAKNSSDRECLKKHNIRYIVNVTANVPNHFEKDTNLKYLQIPITDHWSQNLAAFFPKAIAFIDEARSAQTGVLVHCLAGISRSVTVTIAYLMHHKKLSLNEAYDYVKEVNPKISPNFNFMGQLSEFEGSLREHVLCPACSHRLQGEPEDGDAAQSPVSSASCTCAQSPKWYFSSPLTVKPEHKSGDLAPS